MVRLKVEGDEVVVAGHFLVAIGEQELGEKEVCLWVQNFNLDGLAKALNGGLVVAIRVLEDGELVMNPGMLGVRGKGILKIRTGLAALLVRNGKQAQLVEGLRPLAGELGCGILQPACRDETILRGGLGGLLPQGKNARGGIVGGGLEMITGLRELLQLKVALGHVQVDGRIFRVLLQGIRTGGEGGICLLDTGKAQVGGDTGEVLLDGLSERLAGRLVLTQLGEQVGQLLMGGGMIGVEPYGLLEAFPCLGVEAAVHQAAGFVKTSTTEEETAELKAGPDVIIIEVNGGLEAGAGLGKILGTVMEKPKTVVGVGIVRVNKGGFLQVVGGVMGITPIQGQDTQSVVRTPVTRVLLQEGLKILPGLSMPAKPGLEDAKAKTCLRMGGIILKDPVQVVGGTLVIPFLQKDEGKLVVRVGKAGL